MVTVTGWGGSSKQYLVGGFNPFENYARQNGFIFPKFRGETSEHIWNHHLDIQQVSNQQRKSHQIQNKYLPFKFI